jgi:hypothetical protein
MVIGTEGEVMDGNNRNVLPDCSHRVIRGNELMQKINRIECLSQLFVIPPQLYAPEFDLTRQPLGIGIVAPTMLEPDAGIEWLRGSLRCSAHQRSTGYSNPLSATFASECQAESLSGEPSLGNPIARR